MASFPPTSELAEPSTPYAPTCSNSATAPGPRRRQSDRTTILQNAKTPHGPIRAESSLVQVSERTQYDELSELAVTSALGKWLRRWPPIAIHSTMLAGARIAVGW
jgi:hypothetical protein